MIPEGRLVRSRVVPDAGVALEGALDRRLTGYAVFEPREALLGGDDTRGVLTFEGGVPVLAYHTSGAGGPAALAALAVPGPCRVELYELPPGDLADAHRNEGGGGDGDGDLRVSPAAPAERLAGDPDLADRTRRRVPDAGVEPAEDAGAATGPDAIEAFLADEERVAAIREQARAEARRRAREWGFGDVRAACPDSPASGDGGSTAGEAPE